MIKGLVVDASGQPVGGARVLAMRSDRPRSVVSKPDGTFVIASDGPIIRYSSLLATADNGARQGIFRFHDPAKGPKDPRRLARIVLKPLRKVTVSVVDGHGAPVEGASVVVLDVAFPVAEGRTNARGIVELSAPADVMTHWIFGYKPGVGFDYFENYLILPSSLSPLPERVNLVLNGVRAVRVRALDSANNPVPGVEIVPISGQKRGYLSSVNIHAIATAHTDAHGFATFDWLPADVQPRTNFFVRTRSDTGPVWPGLNPDATSDELTLRVLRVTPISGKVTRPDGSPAAGIVVNAADFDPVMQFGPRPAKTAPDGSFTIDVTPDRSYTVYITDDEWAAPMQTTVDVREGKPRAEVDFRLERGSVIRGRVTAGEPPQPAPGLYVTLTDDESAKLARGGQPGQILRYGPRRTAETDQAGRYAFRVGPGDYLLERPYEIRVGSPSNRSRSRRGRTSKKICTSHALALHRPLPPRCHPLGPTWCGPPIARAVS